MPEPVLRIRISGIHMFLDLPDTHPYLLVKDMDPESDPDPSIIKQKIVLVRKTLIPTVL
jgi:hypothetical protein